MPETLHALLEYKARATRRTAFGLVLSALRNRLSTVTRTRLDQDDRRWGYPARRLELFDVPPLLLEALHHHTSTLGAIDEQQIVRCCLRRYLLAVAPYAYEGVPIEEVPEHPSVAFSRFAASNGLETIAHMLALLEGRGVAWLLRIKGIGERKAMAIYEDFVRLGVDLSYTDACLRLLAGGEDGAWWTAPAMHHIRTAA